MRRACSQKKTMERHQVRMWKGVYQAGCHSSDRGDCHLRKMSRMKSWIAPISIVDHFPHSLSDPEKQIKADRKLKSVGSNGRPALLGQGIK